MQVRDTAAAIAGLAILGVESYRGTWNAVGVTAGLVCLGIVGAGAFERWLTNRNGNGGR